MKEIDHMDSKIETIGDLIDKLQQFDRKMPVRMLVWVDRKTPDLDCGDTDLSGEEEFKIGNVTDLESRIVIEKE